MSYFPQINTNFILTQFPYVYENAFETVVSDLETGPRFTFPRRGAFIDGYPTGPLFGGTLNYTNITDSEVETLKGFFDSMKGRWGRFRFLDPGGNLLQYSEDFSNAYWDKSRGVTVGGGAVDPFRRNLAKTLSGNDGSNSILIGQVGPTDGLMQDVVMCASVYVKAHSANQQLFLGFVDDDTAYSGRIFNIPRNSWVRIDYSVKIWNNEQIRIAIGGLNTWFGGAQIDMFGAQVSPMKGPGGYVKTPGNYGYHENCRFDMDQFTVNRVGPNQNALQLQVCEVNV